MPTYYAQPGPDRILEIVRLPDKIVVGKVWHPYSPLPILGGHGGDPGWSARWYDEDNGSEVENGYLSAAAAMAWVGAYDRGEVPVRALRAEQREAEREVFKWASEQVSDEADALVALYKGEVPPGIWGPASV